MNSVKQARVDAIRSNTAYPVYRGVIGIISIILMVLAGLQGLGAFIGGLMMMSQSFLAGGFVLIVGLALAALAFFMARFWQEAALILADIGDSVMDAGVVPVTQANTQQPAYPVPSAF